ncbi:MAG: hypothetical protein ACN6PN_12615 [Sphingobacterium sp.]
MKTLITSIIFLLLAAGLSAQQDIMSKVSNGFIRDNGLTDLKEISDLSLKLDQEYFGANLDTYADRSIEMAPNASFHKIGYRVSTGVETTPGTRGRTTTYTTYDGLLDITWAARSATTPTKSIEEVSKERFRYLYDVEEKSNFVTDYVKNDKVEGSFIYSKKDNLIIFIILSKTKPETVMGTIIINLPESKRSEFIKTFIEETTFGPNTGRTRTGSGTPTEGRTDSSATRTRTGG